MLLRRNPFHIFRYLWIFDKKVKCIIFLMYFILLGFLYIHTHIYICCVSNIFTSNNKSLTLETYRTVRYVLYRRYTSALAECIMYLHFVRFLINSITLFLSHYNHGFVHVWVSRSRKLTEFQDRKITFSNIIYDIKQILYRKCLTTSNWLNMCFT